MQNPEARWKSRGHFFAAAAEAMRRILVERARRVAGVKHGGGRQRLPMDAAELSFDTDPTEMLAIDEALAELERLRPRTCQVTKLRYFAGLTVDEAAAALDISPRTARNEWRFARAWLFQRLGEGPSPDGPAGTA